MRAALLLAVFAVAAIVVSSQELLLNRALYEPTPIGYMLSACIHRIPSGSFVHPEEDPITGSHTGRTVVRHGGSRDGSIIRVIPKCDTSVNPMLYTGAAGTESKAASRSLLQFPPDYDGWEAYTVYQNSAGFDIMTNLFNTPDSLPVNTPDVLYLFPGLQNVDWIPKVDPLPSGAFDIIQPVLQYPGDQGNYWSVKSWYVTLNAGYLVSDEIQLQPGDMIFGNQTRLDAQTWFIGSTQQNSGQSTTITAQASWLSSQPWAYCTLECYGCQDCGSYPVKAPAMFTDIQLWSQGKLVTPTWKVTPKPPQQKFCNEAAVVDSSDAVHINFGNE